MVINFLREYYSTLVENKIALENRYKDIQIKIHEDLDHVNILEQSIKKKVIGFNPGAEDESEERNIYAFKDEIKKLEEESVSISIKIQEIEDKLVGIKKEVDFLLKQDEHLNKKEIDSDFKLKLLQTQEDERKRIARDLHDTTVQTLASMIHRIELCTKLIEVDPVRCKLELLSMNQTIRSSISDLRKVIYDLRPMSFDDIGIDVTIQRMLEQLKQNAKQTIDIHFDMKGDSAAISTLEGLTLLRVIEEACNNSIKHANASNIYVKFHISEEDIYVSISDDGCGFQYEEVNNSSTNFGVSIMQERIYLLSGKIIFKSEIGEGTTIDIHIPIKERN